MSRLKWIFLFCIASLNTANSAVAQVGNGGGGGDPRIEDVVRTLDKIARFLDLPEVRQSGLFPELSGVSVLSFVSSGINVDMTDRKLKDRFRKPRDFLNFPRKRRILFNQAGYDLFNKLSMDSKVTMIAHELFGLMKLEVNSKTMPYNTKISSRLRPYVYIDSYGQPYLSLTPRSDGIDQHLFYDTSSCTPDLVTTFSCQNAVSFMKFDEDKKSGRWTYLVKHILNLKVDFDNTYHIQETKPEHTSWETIWTGLADYTKTSYEFFSNFRFLRVETRCADTKKLTGRRFFFDDRVSSKEKADFVACATFPDSAECRSVFPGMFDTLERVERSADCKPTPQQAQQRQVQQQQQQQQQQQ